MNFTLRVVNPPAGAAWWIAIWFLPGVGQWDTGWQPISTTSYTFSGVPSGPGDVYVDAYDASYRVLTNFSTRGRISPGEGSTWEYDFSTGVLKEAGGAPGQPHAAIDALSIVPTSAKAGDTIAVAVVLKNTGAVGGWVSPTMMAGGVVKSLYPDYSWAEPGGFAGFAGSFVMPDSDAVVAVWAYHWDGSQWVFDDTRQATVTLISALPASKYQDLGATFAGKVSFG